MKAVILDCNDKRYKEQEITEAIPYLRIQQPNPNIVISWKGIVAPISIINNRFCGNIIEAKLIQVEQEIAIYKLLEEI